MKYWPSPSSLEAISVLFDRTKKSMQNLFGLSLLYCLTRHMRDLVGVPPSSKLRWPPGTNVLREHPLRVLIA